MKKRSLLCLLFPVLLACHRTPDSRKDEWKDYRKGYRFYNVNRDSAFFYFNRGSTNSASRQVRSLCFRLMAGIQSDAGDNYGAQESLIQSLKLLDENRAEDRDNLATVYDELGLTFVNLGDPTQAIIYHRLALRLVKDPETKSYFFNHLGNAFQDKKVYPDALINYQSALLLVKKDEKARARIRTNLAVTRWLQDHRYNAAPELRDALNIRIQAKDSWGEVSSYGHLASFYEYRRPDSAKYFAAHMLSLAEILKSAEEQLLALQRLIPLVDQHFSIIYFKQYQRLNDSVQRRQNVAKNQFALIRYHVEKAKAENLELEKRNAERQYQLIVLAITTISIIVAGIWLYRKRKRRMQLESDRRLQESKLQFSQKVHDKVANGIYRIMSQVEHQPDLNRDSLLDQLEGMYDISRNIAHEEPELAADFAGKIKTMLYAFKRPGVNLAISGNDQELWEVVGINTREQLNLVLQELMVNMSKHSKATRAYLSFTIVSDRLSIEYRDDGVGLSDQVNPGKGMQHTVSRIEQLNGSINFDGSEANGLRVFIHLPIIKTNAV